MKKTGTSQETRQDHAFVDWLRKNWKKVVAGIVIVGGTILVIKNWDEIVELAEKLTTALKPDIKDLSPITAPSIIEETSASPVREMAKDVIRKAPEAPFDVIAHIRNLPENWNASPEKLAEAAELHIDLLPHQTLVDAYTKGIKAA